MFRVNPTRPDTFLWRSKSLSSLNRYPTLPTRPASTWDSAQQLSNIAIIFATAMNLNYLGFIKGDDITMTASMQMLQMKNFICRVW